MLLQPGDLPWGSVPNHRDRPPRLPAFPVLHVLHACRAEVQDLSEAFDIPFVGTFRRRQKGDVVSGDVVGQDAALPVKDCPARRHRSDGPQPVVPGARLEPIRSEELQAGQDAHQRNAHGTDHDPGDPGSPPPAVPPFAFALLAAPHGVSTPCAGDARRAPMVRAGVSDETGVPRRERATMSVTPIRIRARAIA